MANDNILKSFLVRLGFKVDEGQYRRFQESMEKTAKGTVELAKGFVRLGEASAIAGSAMGATLVAAAKHLEGLYFAAQRTGSSGKELQTLGFAAEQVGVSAEQAQAQVEGLANARRTMPGLNGLLGAFGIDPKETDNAKVLLQLMTRLHSLPAFQQAQYAKTFGLDPSAIMHLERNLPEFQKALSAREKLFNGDGADPDAYAAKSHAFMLQVRLLAASFMDLGEKMSVALFPVAEKIMHGLSGVIGFIERSDAATHGWSTRVIALVAALKTLSTVFGVLGKLGVVGGGGPVGSAIKAASTKLGILGKAGAAAGTEAAAGEVAVGGGVAAAAAGEAAAGGGLAAVAAGLLPILIPIILGAGVVASIAYAVLHPMEARKAAAAVNKKVETVSVKLENATDKELKELPSQLKELPGHISDLWQKATAKASDIANLPGQFEIVKAVPGMMNSIAAFTAAMEGHIKNGYGLYRDVAGKLTVGFGHLVKPGEDFTHGLDQQGALALLASDLKDAASFVKSAVHAKLTENQTKALTDFVFNVGKSAFSHSTLLADINSGKMDAAADQFSRWNKVLIDGKYVANRGLTTRRAAEAQLFRDRSPVTITQKTDIRIEGGDPVATGKQVASHQQRVSGDLVRNVAGAIN